jgi:hypothetical protein
MTLLEQLTVSQTRIWGNLMVYQYVTKLLSILSQFSSYPTNNMMKLMNNMREEKK